MEQQWDVSFEGSYDDEETILEIDIIGRGYYDTIMSKIDAIIELGFRGTEIITLVEVEDE